MLGRSRIWWTWLATAVLVAGSLAGCPVCLPLAVGLTGLEAARLWRRDAVLRAPPVQVRIAYLCMLVGGALAPLQFLHWLQLAGTITLLAFGYCPLARLLVLAPWNRKRPLSLALIARVLLGHPINGSVIVT